MKRLFFLLVLMYCTDAGAASYYFSSSGGDDARTPLQAQSAATPWKTLKKLNAFFSSLQAGDSVLFKRGEVFDGRIYITKSGIASHTIVFAAYGTGDKPVINGMLTLSNWVSAGLQTWEAACTSGTANLNMLTLNGNVYPIGRYPNASAPNKGYLSLESHSGNTQITDQQLAASPDWTGGQVIIRKNRWTIDRNVIKKHAGNTISYTAGSAWEPMNGFGYFIQKHPKTLDQLGEWYFDATRKKMKVYFGSYQPTSFNIKVSVVDTLVTLQGRHHIKFDNLAFKGANMAAFAMNGSSNIHISSCEIYFSGLDGIAAANTVNLVVENSEIAYTNNNAFTGENCSYTTLRNNIIRRTGNFAGMGRSDGSYEAIILKGRNNLVEYSRIDSTGYIPITFDGDAVSIKNNFINYFAFVKDDAGGIYTWNNYPNPVEHYGQKIIGNIILNGVGAGAGTDNPGYLPASGIYIDDNAGNVEISSNTVANCSLAGFFNHNAHRIALNKNTFYNNQVQLQILQNGFLATNPVRNNSVKGNILFAKSATQMASSVESITNDIKSFGAFDSNYYCRPIDDNLVTFTSYVEAGKTVQRYHNLESWRSVFGKDISSKKTPVKVPSYTLNKLVGANKFGNGSFNADISGLYCYSSTGACATSWISGGKLDGGALQFSYKAVPGGTNSSSYIIIGIGAVTANKNYIVRFSAIGSRPNKILGMFLRKSLDPYNDLGVRKFGRLTNTRTENEFLLSPSISESNASIVFEIDEREDFTLWLDNIQLNEADVTITNPDNYIHFEYNNTKFRKKVILDGIYIDPQNKRYPGSVDIPPYASVILIKEPNTSIVPANLYVNASIFSETIGFLFQFYFLRRGIFSI